jgi:hypothetical protein
MIPIGNNLEICIKFDTFAEIIRKKQFLHASFWPYRCYINTNKYFEDMKTNRVFFYLAMTLTLVLGSTGCSKDDANTEVEVPIDDGSLTSAMTFTTKDAEPEVAQFFASELSLDGNGSLASWNGGNESYVCRAINSYDDFGSLYCGDKELPKIDFSNHTLIVGWQYITTNVSEIEKLEIGKEDNLYYLDVYATHHSWQDGLTPFALQPFWALFPKLSDAPIQARVVINQDSDPAKDSISRADVIGEWELTEVMGGKENISKLSFYEDRTLTETYGSKEIAVGYNLFAEEGRMMNGELRVACPYHSCLRLSPLSGDEVFDYGIALIGDRMYLQQTHIFVYAGWMPIYVFQRRTK